MTARAVIGLETRTGAGGRIIGKRGYCDLCDWRSRRYGLGNEHLAQRDALAHLRKHRENGR